MNLLAIYSDLQKHFTFDIVCIQGNQNTLYCYGEKVANLAKDFNLDPPSRESVSLKIPASQISKCEDHFKNYSYSYAILELFQLAKNDALNEQKCEVTKSSDQGAIGIQFDNRKADGTFPKRRKTSLESIISSSDLLPDEQRVITLSDEQLSILSQINKWISNDNQIAIISGRAGTGKTTLLKFIVKLLEKRKKTFSLLAPTGRAARVIEKKTGIGANTIHSAIYVLDTDSLKISEDHETQQKAFEEGDFSIDFKLKADENLSQIYIIDESSMVGDRGGSKGDINFGTGRLLTDLLTQIGVIHRKNANTKILFVGDPSQLPPIGQDDSPALDPHYLCKKFQLKSIPECYELKNVMRQSQNSLILSNAEIIRTHISNKKFESLQLKFDGVEVSETNPISAQKKTLDAKPTNSIMITQSNKAAQGYNRSIRSNLFRDKDINQMQAKDLIIVTNNSHRFGCFNGDIYTIVELAESERVTIRLEKSSRFKNKPEIINLSFRDITVRPIEFSDENKYDKKIKVIENLLYKPESILDRSESIANHVYWNSRTKTRNLTPEEMKQDLLSDPYLNAVQVKYSYAITCHKSQGGEWPHVNVFLEGMWANESFYRWLYTAVTRATSTLSFINASYLIKDAP